ncbi:MAG: hypothetical protein QTN59_18635 [Candidatus Electrothrix communis]|nr:MAG: hypothetical protein QTN59_18635 [Candidatus Electrothrix communis]
MAAQRIEGYYNTKTLATASSTTLATMPNMSAAHSEATTALPNMSTAYSETTLLPPPQPFYLTVRREDRSIT